MFESYIFFPVRLEARWKETRVAEGASGEVAEGAGFKGRPCGSDSCRLLSALLPAVSSPGENAAKKHKSHLEDGARRQIWVSHFNWTQTKTLSRETLDDHYYFVNNSPVSCKLNMRTMTLEPLKHLCKRGSCAEANSWWMALPGPKCIFPTIAPIYCCTPPCLTVSEPGAAAH